MSTARPTEFRGSGSDTDIVRHIASFLTLSDATSLYSFPASSAATPSADHATTVSEYLPSSQHTDAEELVSVDSWAVGEGYGGGTLWTDLQTPATPGLIALSPGATPRLDVGYPPEQAYGPYQQRRQRDEYPLSADNQHYNDDDDENDLVESMATTEYLERMLQQKRRQWAQQKLASAVFTHPDSLRSFCVDAYQTAVSIRRHQEQRTAAAPEVDVEPIASPSSSLPSMSLPHKGASLSARPRSRRRLILHAIFDFVVHNLPLSILIDIVEAVGELSLDTTVASYRLTGKTMNAIFQGVIHLVRIIWDFIVNFNPFQLLETVVSFQFNAMERTSEALATGIHSVATGMGSASSMALHRISAANLSTHKSVPSAGSILHDSGLLRPRTTEGVVNKKLLKKLSSINDAARVVSYQESEDVTGGLSKQARTKVQRMMHYDVSLRPFVATVEVPVSGAEIGFGTQPRPTPDHPPSNLVDFGGSSSSFSTDSVASPSSSPFMCTPQSFPPTPQSRNVVMARGSRFTDDVVYLARDRLRLHAGNDSENEKTRGMAKLLKEGERLAVFNAKDCASGIELSCGLHIATKVGNMLYASARSMVPVLRNCYVYFEMTVLPRSATPITMQQTMMTTLSVGLSTEEMPNNTLVGAWQGSCGLCTTGQILVAGQWCTPVNPGSATFSDGSTVGCLVSLDDESAVDTWEGLLVTATVTFNVNGIRCSPMVPPVTRLPFGQQPASSKKRVNSLSPPLSGQSMPSSDSGAEGKKNNPATPPPRPQDASPSPHLPLLVPAAEELYPTVSLHSPATSVLCRFSAEDILATSREAIGAPPGACVYAVDGSVILGAEST